MRSLISKILSNIKLKSNLSKTKFTPTKDKTPLPKIDLYEYFKLDLNGRINYKP